MDTLGWIVGLVAAIALGIAIGMYLKNRIHVHQVRELSRRLADEQQERVNAIMELRAVESRIAFLAEERAQEIVKSWEPDPKSIEEDFLHAEYMANKRKLIDGGRLYQPVETEGEPARISTISFRNANFKPTDPK